MAFPLIFICITTGVNALCCASYVRRTAFSGAERPLWVVLAMVYAYPPAGCACVERVKYCNDLPSYGGVVNSYLLKTGYIALGLSRVRRRVDEFD